MGGTERETLDLERTRALVPRTVAYIRRYGNALDKLRLTVLLGEPHTRDEIQAVLRPYRFDDGSWDYTPGELCEERVGSLGGTIHCLRWLREFGMQQTEEMSSTLEFLARVQEDDGSFYETRAKLDHSPQPWLQEDTLIDRFYFTAAVPVRLYSMGCSLHHVIKPALRWLREHWGDWGLVTGTWYSLWALLCLLHQTDQTTLTLYNRCHDKAMSWIDGLRPQPLTWFLDALQGAGFPSDEPLVVRGMARLLSLQQDDGTWQEPASQVETTVTAIRVLRWCWPELFLRPLPLA